jgi:signal transduction histidine kinase
MIDLNEFNVLEICENLEMIFQIDSFVQIILLLDSEKTLSNIEQKLPQGCLKNVLIINSSASDVVLKQALIVMLEKHKLSEFINNSEVLTLTGAMTAGIAHDFNNIIAGIYSTVTYMKYILQDECDIDIIKNEFKDNLDIIERSSEHGIALVESLLAFFRNENILRQKVDLNQLINNTIKLSKCMIHDSVKINFTPFKISKPEISVLVSLFQQALLNLIINASDAMTVMKNNDNAIGGEINITLSRLILSTSNCKSWRPGAYFYLSIKDCGVGIPEEIKQRIFEPYFSSKPAAKSFGLGLTVIKEFVSQHDGYLELNSDVGVGSEFLIFLPDDNE